MNNILSILSLSEGYWDNQEGWFTWRTLERSKAPVPTLKHLLWRKTRFPPEKSGREDKMWKGLKWPQIGRSCHPPSQGKPCPLLWGCQLEPSKASTLALSSSTFHIAERCSFKSVREIMSHPCFKHSSDFPTLRINFKLLYFFWSTWYYVTQPNG